ncbi:hypothetical protein PoB_005749100 [Plakobranchus ocellatus]|uniref:Uncharacterized protein n=1 Tax=Plakobranchus ocellatus TaxID=259542 RepID=A0AAV4C6Q8_9GAST|nr:hypothetical protein PoB_005749100 [Plakobranchus ocellatus]
MLNKKEKIEMSGRHHTCSSSVREPAISEEKIIASDNMRLNCRTHELGRGHERKLAAKLTNRQNNGSLLFEAYIQILGRRYHTCTRTSSAMEPATSEERTTASDKMKQNCGTHELGRCHGR